MFIADFHTHSRYSRATSRDCVPEVLDLWARRKGLHLIGAGDFTHAAWRQELKEKLVPAGDGLYALKESFRDGSYDAGAAERPRFIVSGEISSIYKKHGKTRKVHNLILLPSLEKAEALALRLEAVGNLHSDGRPILGLDSRDLLEIALEVCPGVIFIPAHIWTPHFSLLGAYSGFDRIEDCFEDLTGHIHALETGLSSDPPMNWRLSALDRFALVSNSDAHSPANLAREANLFDTGLSYPHIARALRTPDSREFFGTLEFFPEEGKYHFDGHRNCKVCLKPSETIAANGICPVCGGRITVGVAHRAELLADRPEGYAPPKARRFESIIPLREIIASSLGVTSASKKAQAQYDEATRILGPELAILRQAPLEDIARAMGPLLAEGIRRLRCGQVEIEPGYDGEYGKVKVIDKAEISLLAGQLSLFEDEERRAPTLHKREEATLAAPAPALNAPPQEMPPMQPDSYPYGLNREQWDAVCAEEPAVAVIAGPGTGKTKTLISRIVHLVEQQGVDPARIAAVTFTNKAAAQLRERLDAHFGDDGAARLMTIGTFHSICLEHLRLSGQAVAILGEQDALSILAEVIKENRETISAREALRRISLVKNGALAVEDIGFSLRSYGAYNARLADAGALDFDDILLRALDLWNCREEPEEIASFAHLLVDEFQDINALQYRLINAWGRRSLSVFVIGDPNQSIYGFRGSDPHCFEAFFADHPGIRRVHLVRNYRSTPQILLCAQSVFPQSLPLEAVRKNGVQARFLRLDDVLSEAIFVAQEINRMVGGIDMLAAHTSTKTTARAKPRSFADIAVLYRTNRQAHALEQCLAKEGIPYTMTGRGDFLSDPRVCAALAFFRCLLNPQDAIARLACREPEDAFLRYAPLAQELKPHALIGIWARQRALMEDPAIEKLLGTAMMYGAMDDFLHAIALGLDADILRTGGKKYEPDAVSLATFHGAKGLEFPVTFLCGINAEVVPFRSRDGKCDWEEEKRLFYVGMTRAQDEMIMVATGEPSPFLSALPEGTLHAQDAFRRRPSPAASQTSLF